MDKSINKSSAQVDTIPVVVPQSVEKELINVEEETFSRNMDRKMKDDELEMELDRHIHIVKDGLEIWKDMQQHESQLSLKRRYLMGLSTQEESVDQNGISNITTNNSPLPESFLRQDDLFYDHLKILVRRCFQGCHVDTQNPMLPHLKVFDLHSMSTTVFTLLDEFSNIGLYNLARLFTRGLITFVKTRPQMKRVIKSSLLAIENGRFLSDYLLRLHSELSQLLNSPENFQNNRKKHVKVTMKEFHVDILKVLDGLEDMKFQTLTAMYRKLKGSKPNGPRLHHRSSRKPKARLIKQIRNLSLGMIQQLDESDELQEPLGKALSVAKLALNMVSSSQDVSVPTFLEVTPEIKMVQDEIVKAIQLLDQRIRKEDMMKLRHLLDPDSKAEGKSLKSAIRNILTELVFECVDMDTVPDSLLGALSIINKRLMYNKRRYLSEEFMNEDVECILNVSAYLKQLLWKGNPGSRLDQDFADAYMVEGEESDDGDIFDDDQKLHANSMDECQIRFNDFGEEVGSTNYAEDDTSFDSPLSTCETNLKYTGDVASSILAEDVCSDTETNLGEMLIAAIANNNMNSSDFSKNNMNSSDNRDSCSEQNLMSGSHKNSYVAIQEVCDNTSVVAYQLIGHMLSEFGHLDGLGLDENEESYLRGCNSRAGHSGELVSNFKDEDASGSIVVEAVHKVLPLFPKSELKMVKKFMSS